MPCQFKHLKENGLNYFDHFKYAMKYSWVSLKASFCFTIHAFYPDHFSTTGSDLISELNTNIQTTNEILHEQMSTSAGL